MAVSGGIDSVVLLDELVKSGRHKLVVARFVAGLAKRYGLDFEMRREELGQANEELARFRRYNFLFDMTEKFNARLTTAHHLDDLIETVAINLTRGTRWRGLAGMSDQRIWRPFLSRTKSELKEYATFHQLEWVEDETNLTAIYQRNRLRTPLSRLSVKNKRLIFELWQKQISLKGQITEEVDILGEFVSNRYFMTMIDEVVARELIYSYILARHRESLLTSQVDYLLTAVKIGRAGTVWQVSGQIQVRLTRRDAIIKRTV